MNEHVSRQFQTIGDFSIRFRISYLIKLKSVAVGMGYSERVLNHCDSVSVDSCLIFCNTMDC